MAFNIDKRSFRQIQSQKRSVPIDQIIAVQGQNPLAAGIQETGNVLGQAMAKRAELQRQGQQIAQLARLSGQEVPVDNSLTPELYEKALALKTAEDAKKASRAKERVDLEFKLEQLRKGSSVFDPVTGKTETVPGVEGLNVIYDDVGNPYIKRDEGYKPIVEPPKNQSGGRGSVQQSQFVDIDGTPLLFDRDRRSYLRSSDNLPPKGNPSPMKGNAEAVTIASRGTELLPKVDILFDKLKGMSELSRRASVTPGISNIAYPEINQLKNEMEQVGFTFGGKNFTGNERSIIVNTMIPSNLDNKASLEKKRAALKGYISGNIDLLAAANLLGAEGAKIRSVIQQTTGLKTINSKPNKKIPTHSFNSESEAEAANLPDGTPIMINGTPGVWRK